MANSDLFLISFNRIEKWMRDEMGNARNMGFTELVRRLAQRKQLMIRKYEDDLLQLAQLRNAIVHDRIAVDFVIAEPNDWTVKRIQLIEQELIQPETVLPRFAKRVTGFEQDLPLLELLKIVAEKRYSQFPLYNKGKFVALITLRNIGFWLAKESQKGPVDLTNKRALDLIIQNGKYTNYHFVPVKTHIYEVEAMFREQGTLEAVLITKDGNPDGNLLGIVRPRDIYKQIEKD
ncbi:CBS domain-containing protein [Enterococcus faecium]|uniref:CBS domain-containing protein n=1 Tax=Enterococcus faecium TaxID=1352 RepID=UPI0019D91FAF|nr:CBS domain-containing protein [Enterococcus faecium]EME7121069.1 CBS domain-containing protein [Enterococcus faecium]EME7150906.1 CBS domain-containing protein [Enterococcus faecium]EME8118344.1 CBS domain-containing protein [Enterococcus faecium]EME8192935.1 CBS domain-containing protein [Enterococcus faecium]